MIWLIGIKFIFFVCLKFFVFKSIYFKNIKFLVKNFIFNCQSKWFNNSFGFKFCVSWIFIIVLGMNLWGMVPYIFGLTSQIFFAFAFSCIYWLRIFVLKMTWGFFKFVSHLVPQRGPLVLGSFISIIELVSNLIRPLTLRLRLSINITTGHIFISLLRTGILNLTIKKNFIFCFILKLILIFYFFFEYIICFIQSVVISLLVVQYTKEIVK